REWEYSPSLILCGASLAEKDCISLAKLRVVRLDGKWFFVRSSYYFLTLASVGCVSKLSLSHDGVDQ
ncbi:hypothetical protein WUBG_10158, partial [Wuchereria bancrofti]